MKVIIAVLAGSILSVVTNLVSNFLAPEADRHKILVFSAFIGLVILIIVLTLWPDTPNREVKEIVAQLIKAREQDRLDFGQREHDYQVDFRQREHDYQGQVRALTEAVTALTRQKGLDSVNALAQLRENNTEEAETIFAAILERKVAEGQVAYQQAAEAARHLGALAFLHDTAKALTAYRRAVELDPANMDGCFVAESLT
jgi:hypothetical protein